MSAQTKATNVQNITLSATIEGVKYEVVKASELFPDMGYEENDKDIVRRAERTEDCVISNPIYMPTAELLNRLLDWWCFQAPIIRMAKGKKQVLKNPRRLKPFGAWGETGTGKTELMMYLADKLNEPFYVEKITPGMVGEKFEGDRELISTENGVITSRNYSKAATGYRDGGIVVLDEVDKANEDMQATLHNFLERKPWTLSVFKETLNCHENTRIVATANTLGEGGSERYTTSGQMDMAVRARIGWEQAHFPEEQHELQILKNTFKALPSTLRLRMVKTANACRDALLGPDRDGKVDEPVSFVFSTRPLVQWGEMMMCYGKNRTPLDSLKFAFFGSVNPDENDLVMDILNQIWADDLNRPLGDLIAKMSGK